MPLLTSILFLLVLCRVFGQLMTKLGQPGIVGEILAGIILGPSILNFIQPTQNLAGISDLSVFLIVVSAGLEMELIDVLKAFRGKGFFIAFCSFAIPFVAGVSLGAAFRMDPVRSVFLGLCISITALPVAIRILETFGLLNTEIAKYSIATAILNDTFALLFLGVILDMPQDPNVHRDALTVLVSLGQTSIKLITLGAIILLVSLLLSWGSGTSRYIERFLERMITSFGRESLFGIAIVFVLIFASMSERLGSHFVIGAFFGALLLSRPVFGPHLFEELENTINSITAGFLAPIFFGFLGLNFSIKTLRSPFFVLCVLAVSMGAKIFAGYSSSRMVRVSRANSLGIGIILNGRGIMELVVANIALQKGFINEELFSTLVLMGIFTTLATPILFRHYVLPKLAPLPAGNAPPKPTPTL